MFYKMKSFVFFLDKLEENLKEGHLLINLIIYTIYAFCFDNGMKLNNGYTTKLDHLLQKSITYKNY